MKYNNKKIMINGVVFDSQKEYRRYQKLVDLQQAGKIHNLQTQVKFILADKVKFKNEKRAKTAIRYIADFVYTQDGKQVVEDVKSPITRKNPVYRIKKHLMKSVHNIDVMEI